MMRGAIKHRERWGVDFEIDIEATFSKLQGFFYP